MKKFNADYITRTVVYSDGIGVRADMQSMTMEEFPFRVIGTLSGDELLSRVRETYYKETVGIKSVEYHEEKRRISTVDFILHSEPVTTKEDTGE